MKFTLNFLSLAGCLLGAYAFAHGEDKPGPNGGFIRMPGAFHTEVVPITQHQFKVYLLDINWKNPSTVNSSLTVTYSGSPKHIAQCAAKEGGYFQCSLPESVDIGKRGHLTIASKREGQQGVDVTYDLPLKAKGHGKIHH